MKHFFSSFQVNNVNNYDNIINHDSSFQLYNLIYVVHIVLCRECDNENVSRAFFDTLHPHCLHLSHVYNYAHIYYTCISCMIISSSASTEITWSRKIQSIFSTYLTTHSQYPNTQKVVTNTQSYFHQLHHHCHDLNQNNLIEIASTLNAGL